MSEFFQCILGPVADVSLIVEDDGRVAFAYLLRGREIVADVWLYNQMPAPSSPEWYDPSIAPFLNPSEYACQPNDFVPTSLPAEVGVKWENSGNGVVCARLFIRDVFHAKLCEGQKPGHCRFAKKDGPLAKVLA